MSAQFFHLSPTETLAGCVAAAISELPDSGLAPILVVDSPFAVQALKKALADSGWPGRDQGAPLPWCGSLEQGFESLVSSAVLGAGAENFPRPSVVRRIQLAQQLLDHPGLSNSLGGSAKAALELAGQWIEIFEGWEWLEQQRSRASAQRFQGQISSDLQTLRRLQQENQQPNDRAFWAVKQAPKRVLYGQQEIWFCMARTPSELELAIAKTLWGADDSRIRAYVTTLPDPLPAPTAVRQLISANSLEQAAWSAAQVILQWRGQGLNDIGVVPLDRKVVRRLRALLDRAGEPFSDRSGWSLDTTVAATALAGLSDLLSGRGNTQSLLEWINSPFVTRALHQRFEFDRAQRQALDSAMRSFGRIAPVSLAALFDQELLPQAMRDLLPLCDDKRAPLFQWSSRLLRALEACGLEAELANDAAGQSVLGALQVLAAESAQSVEPVSAALWQSVLSELLSESRFAEPPSEAAVRVCSLSSLLWRLPQAVLVIGAEAGRLPQPLMPRFFEPQRFAEMGLQVDPQQAQAELFAQFVSAWIAPIPIAMIACSEKPDVEVEFSGWVELLALNHQKSVHHVKASDFVARRALATANFSADVPLDTQLEGRLPDSLSVSSLQSLANCELQFYLQTVRGLAPIQSLEEEAAPSDLGSLLHWVLRGALDPKSSESEWQAWLEKEIDRVLSTQFFQKQRDKKFAMPMPQALRAALRADAMAGVPVLGEWLGRHGPSGLAVTQDDCGAPTGDRHCEAPKGPWQSTLTEQPVSRVLEPLGITIKGQIDRIEKTAQGLQLIDFKTTDPKELKRRLKTIDGDVQLALYAWLMSPQPIESAIYVSIRRDKVQEVSVASDATETLSQRVEDTVAMLSAKLQSMVSGNPIRAEGMHKHAKICEQCSVRGICRRDDLKALDLEQEEDQ